ncbi:MAG: acyl-CoA dehydrogenase family protein [Janthinobacterium lividum]
MTHEHDDFEIIRDEARRFLADAAQPEHLKPLLEQPGGFDRQTWKGAAELGWPLTSFDEAHGGLGLGWRGLCVLAEELGRTTLSVPLLPTALAGRWLLGLDAADEATAAVAETLVAGERHACVAFAQAGAAGVAATPTLALRDGRLFGETAITPFAASADYALVPALDGTDFCLVLVRTGGMHGAPSDAARHGAWNAAENAAGGAARTASAAGAPMRVDVPNVIDNSRAAARLRFDGAPALTRESGEHARQRFWQLLGLAALATAFEQVGGAQTCLDMARGYALERKAFGQQIGRFQAIKSKLADMYIHIELARGCALDALAAFERGDAEWEGLAAAARLAATDAYEFAARENIQTHGAIGVTWEAMPHHHYRRSRALAVELGASLVWRERLFSQIGFDHAA